MYHDKKPPLRTVGERLSQTAVEYVRVMNELEELEDGSEFKELELGSKVRLFGSYMCPTMNFVGTSEEDEDYGVFVYPHLGAIETITLPFGAVEAL